MNLQGELEKSYIKIKKLTDFLPEPKTDHEKDYQRVYKFNLIVSDLYERGKISNEQEKKLRKMVAPLEYKNILTSPDIVNNPKKRKSVEVSLLNDWVKLSGFDNVVAFIDS